MGFIRTFYGFFGTLYGFSDKDGWKPQPHPGTHVIRCGCFLPDLTRFTN